MKRGDIVYIIISNYHVEPVKVIQIQSNLVTVRLAAGGAIRVPRGRLYRAPEEAAAQMLPDEGLKYRSLHEY